MESKESASVDDYGGLDTEVQLADADKGRAHEQPPDANGHQRSPDDSDAGPELYVIHGPEDLNLKPCDGEDEQEALNRTSDSYGGGNAGNHGQP